MCRSGQGQYRTTMAYFKQFQHTHTVLYVQYNLSYMLHTVEGGYLYLYIKIPIKIF